MWGAGLTEGTGNQRADGGIMWHGFVCLNLAPSRPGNTCRTETAAAPSGLAPPTIIYSASPLISSVRQPPVTAPQQWSFHRC